MLFSVIPFRLYLLSGMPGRRIFEPAIYTYQTSYFNAYESGYSYGTTQPADYEIIIDLTQQSEYLIRTSSAAIRVSG